MHAEIRLRGKKKFYYLAHSFRDRGKVKKVRRYLGANLSEKKIQELRPGAEQSILKQIEIYRKIGDPLHTVLSPREKGIVETLVSKGMKMQRLSEKQWLTFSGAFAYDTNAIEGSTVTASEVRDIIEKNEWPKERSKEEVAETYGVVEAVGYIRKTKDHISLKLIKDLHKIVFKSSKGFAGKFRGKGVEVVVADQYGRILHRGAPQRDIISLLRELILWYDKNKKKYHPIVLAAVVHNQFENIHPFQDGNGRVGRLLLNNILLKCGLPPVNIELKNCGEYYSTLQAYEKQGNLRPTIELILKEYRAIKRSLGM